MAKKQIVHKMAKRARRTQSPGFGAVSAINTAPVSVGNSVRGSAPRVSQTTDGARVVGRDFAFALSATASTVTGWELIGGMPVTPCCLPSSILRNYCQMFNKFKVNRLTVHYITSSPTSQAGDVLFYFEKDRMAPMPDYSSSSFLPYMLSDPHTVIGPQWTNHSVTLKPAKDWKTTLFGNQTDLNEDSEGTLFFFSKTNAANSPGYLLIDYDISFKELSVNPRAGTLPVARAQSSFVCFTSTASITSGGQVQFNNVTTGKTIANIVSTVPTGALPGDIYKAALQVTASQLVNAVWTGTPAITSANMLQYGDATVSLIIDDGTTFFSRYDGSNWFLYATLENAVTDTYRIRWQTTSTTPTINLCAEVQLVRNIESFTQSAY
nr:MAG: hypothetical protein 3 [Luteoviridae sp.]